MITSPWDLGLVIAGFVLNAILLYGAYQYSRQSIPAGESDASAHEGDPEATDDGAVECGHCGVENDPEYRFCRSCVSELPGTGGYDHPGSGKAGRASL